MPLRPLSMLVLETAPPLHQTPNQKTNTDFWFHRFFNAAVSVAHVPIRLGRSIHSFIATGRVVSTYCPMSRRCDRHSRCWHKTPNHQQITHFGHASVSAAFFPHWPSGRATIPLSCFISVRRVPHCWVGQRWSLKLPHWNEVHRRH